MCDCMRNYALSRTSNGLAHVKKMAAGVQIIAAGRLALTFPTPN